MHNYRQAKWVIIEVQRMCCSGAREGRGISCSIRKGLLESLPFKGGIEGHMVFGCTEMIWGKFRHQKELSWGKDDGKCEAHLRKGLVYPECWMRWNSLKLSQWSEFGKEGWARWQGLDWQRASFHVVQEPVKNHPSFWPGNEMWTSALKANLDALYSVHLF